MSEPRIAYVGCRDWDDESSIRHTMLRDHWRYQGLVIITGDAAGADRIAAHWAARFALECVVHRADWDRLGKRAGPERNARVVADCDSMVAFWDGRSRGTLDAITQAVRAGKPVTIVPKVMP